MGAVADSHVSPVAGPFADGELTDGERLIRERAAEVVARVIRPAAASVDRDGRFPAAGVAALAAAGLGGLRAAVALGGGGASAVAYALTVEEIAAACGSTSTVHMTQTHCITPIELAGSEAQRQRWIPVLCAARVYGALAVTEPDAGSDVAALRTRARPQRDGYVLDGSKTFITTGDRAGIVVVFATLNPGAGRGGIAAFLVEGDRPGLVRGRTLAKLGLRGSSTTELFFEDCWIPRANLLADAGAGFGLCMRSVIESRLSAAAQGVGYARAAYFAATRWTAQRGLLEASAGVAQAAQFRLADLRVRWTAARAVLLTAARAVDCGRADASQQTSIAKLVCTDAGFTAALDAADLLGIDGDDPACEVERIVRDAKVAQIYDGTNQVQRLIIARDIASGYFR